MNLLRIDEMSANSRRSKPYSIYFGEMDITRAQIKRRTGLAKDIEQSMLQFMQGLITADEYGMLSVMSRDITDEYRQNYLEAVRNAGSADDYILDHAGVYTERTRQNTVQALERLRRAEMERSEEDEAAVLLGLRWYLSEDRAILNGEDQANYLVDHIELQEAILNGYTRKEWRSMRDKRVRDTHKEVDGIIIPIDEPFEVGGYLMMAPKDDSLGASEDEITNCRCSLKFHS